MDKSEIVKLLPDCPDKTLERRGFSLAISRLRPPPANVLKLFGQPLPALVTPELACLPRPAIVFGGVPCAAFASACLSAEALVFIGFVEHPHQETEFKDRADLVLTKAGSVDEILDAGARIMEIKQQRRAAPLPIVDPKRIAWKNQHVDLPYLEARIARRLVRARGSVVSKRELLRDLWDYPGEDEVSRAVDTHIYRLRRRLAEIPGMNIETIRQRGYRLVLDS